MDTQKRISSLAESIIRHFRSLMKILEKNFCFPDYSFVFDLTDHVLKERLVTSDIINNFKRHFVQNT
jgi:hypothetical protein